MPVINRKDLAMEFPTVDSLLREFSMDIQWIVLYALF